MSDPFDYADRMSAKTMNRSDLTRRLAAKLGDEAVIAGIGNTNFDLWASGRRPQNFYMLGSMGLASAIGLGVALAQPQRKVFALDGDGSLLMQLGSLGTIAEVAPKNLAVIVWDNGIYQITGSQKTLTAGRTDLVAMARAAGIEHCAWAADEDHFEALVDRCLGDDGPFFIGARVDGEKAAGTTERDPVKIRINFLAGIAGNG